MQLLRAFWLSATLVLSLRTETLRAEALVGESDLVRVVLVTGNAHTRSETLLELLPRQPPAHYSKEELQEFERRVQNLAIFDHVRVERHGDRVVLEVREKWTLIPSIRFSTSSTLADTYAELGLTEYNFLGRADRLGLSVSHAQRGWGVSVSYFEHSYRHRWSFGTWGSASTAKFRASDGTSWEDTWFSLDALLISPPWLSQYLNYKIGTYYAREIIREQVGSDVPPSSHAAGSSLAFSWDAYHWADFTPKGIRGELLLSTGAFLGTSVPQARHLARLSLIVAHPLARYTVLTARSVSAASTRGNSGFSTQLGSIEGVRGLEDGLYRNWLQSYLNLELRQAVPLAQRWALQGVLFGDVAVFEQLTSGGERGDAGRALSVGGGLRVIPTWLADVVLRLDLARLIEPSESWFLQFGVNQYF